MQRHYEMVLRRQGVPDESVFIDTDEPLLTGQPFPYGGTKWVITKDDGPSAVEGYALRFICEPATH